MSLKIENNPIRTTDENKNILDYSKCCDKKSKNSLSSQLIHDFIFLVCFVLFELIFILVHGLKNSNNFISFLAGFLILMFSIYTLNIIEKTNQNGKVLARITYIFGMLLIIFSFLGFIIN